jgi:hypothetical protein
MRKLFLGIAVLLAFGMMTVSAFAIKLEDGTKLTGEHYNLNIIGVKEKEDIEGDGYKNVGDSSGHTLFVPIEGGTKIYMTQGAEFDVADRDGTDGRAEFVIGPGYYLVCARPLGKPGDQEYDIYVNVAAKGKFAIKDEYGDPIVWLVDDQGNVIILLGAVDISRVKGKPETKDINSLFYVSVDLYLPGADPTVDDPYATYTNEWVFDIPELVEYFWEYTNNNLKLLQVRFYPVDSNPFQAAPALSNPTTTWGALKE